MRRIQVNIMDSAQGAVEDKTTGQVQMSPLVMVMSLAQVSPLVKEDMDPTQVVSQGVVKDKSMALDQDNPLIMENMDLALINLLARDIMSLDQNPI